MKRERIFITLYPYELIIGKFIGTSESQTSLAFSLGLLSRSTYLWSARLRDFDLSLFNVYISSMLKNITLSASMIIMFAIATPASACDLHGAGYSPFGIPGANWKPYNPRDYTQDPALLNKETSETALVTPRPIEKKRPSFSNVANNAANIAKARVARKAKNQDLNQAPVKKAALDADR